MKPQPKRTTTQQGLGKATAEVRRTTTRGVAVEGGPPISAPPPSGPNSDAPAPRHTRAIESSRPASRQTRDIESTPPAPRTRSKAPPAPAPSAAESRASEERALARQDGDPPRADTKPPRSQAIERDEPGARVERAERVERTERTPSSRTPVDVTRVDTNRLQKPASARTGLARPTPAEERRPRFEVEEVQTGTRRTSVDARPGSRTAEGRPLGRGTAGTSGTAGASGAAGTSSIPSGTARSRRPSLREDVVGPAVERTPIPAAAARQAGQIVPRLVRTKAEIAAAPIDHRAGFLLAHIDGKTSVQGLVDIAGMGEDEVQQILDRLRRLGIVATR